MLSSFTHTLSHTLSGRGSHASGSSPGILGGPSKPIHVAVVGLSGAEKGGIGVGKSCLCSRFVRPLPDEYGADHISVLSATDFAGRVINNDHWLYWGECGRPNEPYYECQSSGPDTLGTSTSTGNVANTAFFGSSSTAPLLHFSLIEHTEFLDDASFQPFHSGKCEPYVKRICQVKLHSPEKLMYVCKDQLGIEREYVQHELPDGRFNVDGFICCFDVSVSGGRQPDQTVEQTATLLSALLRTRKPVVLVTTKHDEISQPHFQSLQRLLQRREFRTAGIPLIETSAHLNINVDQAFFVLASQCDRKLRIRPTLPFAEALRLRQQRGEIVSLAFAQLLASRALCAAGADFQQQTRLAQALPSAIASQTTPTWSQVRVWLRQQSEYAHYVQLFGSAAAKQAFEQQRLSSVEQLAAGRLQSHLRRLRAVFDRLLGERFETQLLYRNDRLLHDSEESDLATVEFESREASRTRVSDHEKDSEEEDDQAEDDDDDNDAKLDTDEETEWDTSETLGEDPRKDSNRRELSSVTSANRRKRLSVGSSKQTLQRLSDDQLWQVVKMRFARHAQFDEFFVVSTGRPWYELTPECMAGDPRIPFDLLDTNEAQQLFAEYRRSARLAQKRRAMRLRFKRLLRRTVQVTPGKSLNEVRILFMGRTCYESLSEQNVIELYEQHQQRLRTAAALQLRELLAERVSLCQQLLGHGEPVRSEHLETLATHLSNDQRWKALDLLDQERSILLLKHAEFLQNPLPESCPFYPSCMDLLIPQTLSILARKYSAPYHQTIFRGDKMNDLTLTLLGSSALVKELAKELKAIHEQFEHNGCRFRLQLQLLPLDQQLDQSQLNQCLFGTSNEPGPIKHGGCFAVYSTIAELQQIGQLLQQSLLTSAATTASAAGTDPAGLDGLDGGLIAYHSQAVMLLANPQLSLTQLECEQLRTHGEQQALQMHVLHLDVSNLQQHLQSYVCFERASLESALHALVEQIQGRADLLQLFTPATISSPPVRPPTISERPFLRVLACLCCGDLLPLEELLTSIILLSNGGNSFEFRRTSSRSFCVSFQLPNVRQGAQTVELLLSSYHGAQTYRDELLHGFLLLCAADRPASFAALRCFTQHIPNTPTQILVHRLSESTLNEVEELTMATEEQILNEATEFANRIQAHLSVFSIDHLQDLLPSLNSFFAELVERKPQIEKAFQSELDNEYANQAAVVAAAAASAAAAVASIVASDRLSSNLNQPPPLPVRGESMSIQPILPSLSSTLGHPPPKPARGQGRLRALAGSGNGRTSSCSLTSSVGIAENRLSCSDQADTPSPLLGNYQDRQATPSDDSEIYASIFNQEGSDHLLKPSQIRQRKALQSEIHKSFQSCDSISQSVPGSGQQQSFSPQPPPPLRSQSRASSGASSSGPAFNTQPTSSAMPPFQSNRGIPNIQNPAPNSQGATPTPPPPPIHAFGQPFTYSTIGSCSLANLHQLKRSSAVCSRSPDLELGSASPQPSTVSSVGAIAAADFRRSFASERSHSMFDPPSFQQRRQKILKQQSTTIVSLPCPKATDRSQRLTSSQQQLGSFVGSAGAKMTSDPSSQEEEDEEEAEEEEEEELSDSSELSAYGAGPPPDPAPLDPTTVHPPALIAWLEQRQASDEQTDTVEQETDRFKKETKPGKLNLSQFDNITSAVGRLQMGKPHPLPHKLSIEQEGVASETVSSSEYGHIKEIGHPVLNFNQARPPRASTVGGSAQSDSDLSSPEKQAKNVTRTEKSRGVRVQPPRAPEPTISHHCPFGQPKTTQRSQTVDFAHTNQFPSLLELKPAIERPSKAFSKRKSKESARKEKISSKSRSNKVHHLLAPQSTVVPQFVEKCVQFIEQHGLDTEGLYRVPGNKTQVDVLFGKFQKDPNMKFDQSDLQVSTLTTALKEFLTKRITGLIPLDKLADLEKILTREAKEAKDPEVREIRSQELKTELRSWIRSLPPQNQALISYLCRHLEKVAQHNKKNNMDVKNLAICWSPTLLQFSFNDISMFESMRPRMEEVVQLMITEKEYLFE